MAKMVPCKLCGKDTPEGSEYCHECVWKAKWAEHIINSPELAIRRKRSHLVHLISLDPDAPFAVFGTPGEAECSTSLKQCTCKDFSFGRGKRPCKHIFRLAEELGLFQCEHFELGEDDYTLHNLAPNVPESRRLCLPEVLRDADEELIKKFVSIVCFIIQGRRVRLELARERLRTALDLPLPEDVEQRRKIEDKKRKAQEYFNNIEKFRGEGRDFKQYQHKGEKDTLRDRLQELGLIEIVQEAKNSTQERLTIDVRLTSAITLQQAEKIEAAYYSVYHPLYRHAVTDAPLDLISHVVNSKRRAEELLRPHDAKDTSDWAFHVPECFNDALDIHLVSRKWNTVEYTAWTQGTNFSFDAGDVLYRDIDSYKRGIAALQIVSATPARGTKIEGLNLGIDTKRSTKERQGDEADVPYAGSVTYKDFENGDTKTMTQIDFVKMLIGPTPMVTGVPSDEPSARP